MEWWLAQARLIRPHLARLIGADAGADLDRRIIAALALPPEQAAVSVRTMLRAHPAVREWLAAQRNAEPEYREGPSATPPPGNPCYLVADVPEQHPLRWEIPVQVSVRRDPGDLPAVPTEPFGIPPGGLDVTFVLSQRTMDNLTAPKHTVRLMPATDSPWVLFTLRAPTPGKHPLRIRAYAAGSFLAELAVSIDVTVSGPRGSRRHSAVATVEPHQRGRVVLDVSRDAAGFHYLLQGADAVQAHGFLNRADSALADLATTVGTLNTVARGKLNSDPDLDRDHIRDVGAWLWQHALPRDLHEPILHALPHARSLVIAGDIDVVPWEMMLPMSPSRQRADFLADTVPVLRRAERQGQTRSVSLDGRVYVAPGGSTAAAEANHEIARIRDILGHRDDDRFPPGKEAIRSILDAGGTGLMHLAAHQSTDGGWSSVQMPDGSFTPLALGTVVGTRGLAGRAPLVFFNACRTVPSSFDGAALVGWANQFMAAGAGAFIGSMFAVRSETATRFAVSFYQSFFHEKVSLADAVDRARATVRSRGEDPTWLSYAVYGDPAATVAAA